MTTKDQIIDKTKEICKKFVEKVDTDRARSVETYKDCKDVLKMIEEHEKENNNEL